MRTRSLLRTTTVAVLAIAGLDAQQANAQGEAPKVVTPALDFSGVIYANYQRRTDSTARAGNAGNPANKFDVERVYLTFRMPVGDRMSIRATTDIFNGDQSGTSYYRGWTVRMKYAYLQWNMFNDIAGAAGMNLTTRFGMLQNTVIEHMESFWPRYLSQTAVERTAGFFASADLGASALLTLPKKWGEVYATILNGPGYTQAENDRFKDPGARLSLTPLGNSNALGGWAKTFTITPWIYRGKTASAFQNGGTGQVGTVSEGLKRNRQGIFIGVKDPRLTFGVDYAKSTFTRESGANTTASPRAFADSSGKLTSGFVLVRPGALFKSSAKLAKWGVVGRLDTWQPNTALDAKTQLSIVSLFWEPTAKVTFSLDGQNLLRKDGSVVPETKTLFLRLQAAF